MTENTQVTGGLVAIPTTALSQGRDGNAGLSVPMPFAQRIVLVEDTYVAGTTHVEDIDEVVAGMRVGQELALERDVANAFDPWAIRVLCAGRRIGFVSCDTNELLARLMDGGKRVGATVTEFERLGRWHKIHMEVFLDD